jgi:predicted RNase H-like nuclease (RuvC/YqgF family)
MRHFALLFLLFISSLCHSQSKKDQIQILTIQVDSLYQLLKKKDNKFTDLETKCAQKEVNLSTQISALNNQLSSSQQNAEKCQAASKQAELKSKLLEEQLQALNLILKNKSDSISLLKLQISELRTNKEFVVTFQEEVVSVAKDQDERFGNDSKTCLMLYIDGTKIDKYCDYGVATISNDITPVTAWLSSENLEKYFTAEIVDSNNLTVVKIVLTNEGEREIWARKYHLSQNGKWAITECIGDCK